MGMLSMVFLLPLCAGEAVDDVAFSAQAVLWRDSGTVNGRWWTLCVLLRNESNQAVSVPRFPEAYNTEYQIRPGIHQADHYDHFASKYPDDYVPLSPKQVCLWQLKIVPKKDAGDNEVEIAVSASFPAYVEGKPVGKQSVECLVISRLKPTPDEWLEKKALGGGTAKGEGEEGRKGVRNRY